MVMQCPECPQTVEELEVLLDVIFNPKYNETPEAYRQKYEAGKSALSDAGIKGREVRALLLAHGLDVLPDEFEKDYSHMLQWGKTQKKARRHYDMHFRGISLDGGRDGPCIHCNELYKELCSRYANELAKERGIDTVEHPEMLDVLVREADLEYGMGF